MVSNEQKFDGVVIGTALKNSGYGESKKEWIASQIQINAADESRDIIWINGEFKIGTKFSITATEICQENS